MNSTWFNNLSQERLKQVLDYNPDTGVFTRLIRTANRTNAGDIAGCSNDLGYLRTTIDSIRYRNHRLAFLYMTGKFPDGEVDHINGITSDNRWCNLRVATRIENCRNSKKPTTNKSGIKGVRWVDEQKKWECRIWNNGKAEILGYFESLLDAASLMCSTRNRRHGEFRKYK